MSLKKDSLSGNLCRCTGYRPIRDALEKTVGKGGDDHFQRQLQKSEPEKSLIYESEDGRFFMPQRLEELWPFFDRHSDSRIVVGATDLGLDITKKMLLYLKSVRLKN